MLCAKYNLNVRDLIPNFNSRHSPSMIWKGITDQLREGGKFYSCFKENIGLLQGNGESILFWEDRWLNGERLKEKFPRIYALSMLKNAPILKFGSWVDDMWSWKITLRRDIFDWEIDQWQMLLRTLSFVDLDVNRKDRLIWKPASTGHYSSKFFRQIVEGDSPIEGVFSLLKWRGCVPPKVEIFLWFLFQNRLPVLSYLSNCNIVPANNTKCPLCKEDVETIDHIFLWCRCVSAIWSGVCTWWNISVAIPKSIVDWFSQWLGLMPSVACKEFWFMLFAVISWIIWLWRNGVVFENKVLEANSLFFMIKSRLAWWCWAKWPNASKSVDEILLNPSSLVSPKKHSKVKCSFQWEAPATNWWKFNVDASVLGKPGPAGIGRVLRNDRGIVLAMFSKFAGEMDSNKVELRAIKEAFLLLQSKDLSNIYLEVESDSLTAVTWCNFSLKRPWRLIALFAVIDRITRKFKGCRIVHKGRCANSFADALARQGINRDRDFFAWIE